MAKLFYITKGEAQEIPIGQELTIGRGYSNLLRLEGEEISRVHAIIYKRDDDFLLRDLDSKNGIFLNGLKVSTAELNADDKIQLGKHLLIFDPTKPVSVKRAKPADSGRPAKRDRPGPPPPPPPQAPLARLDEYDDGVPSTMATPPVAPIEDKFTRSQTFRAPMMQAAGLPVGGQGGDRLEEVVLLDRRQLAEIIQKPANELPPGAAQLEAQIMQQMMSMALAADGDQALSFTRVFLEAMTGALQASGGVVVVRSPQEEGGFSPLAIYPAQADVAVNRVVMREGFSDGRAILCPATADCGLFRDSTTVTRDRITTLLAVPLNGQEELAGLIYLDRKGDDAEPFLTADLVAVARVARLLELHLYEQGGHIAQSDEAVF